jgi:hypothetical protein
MFKSALLSLASSLGIIWAQSNLGSIAGTVTDASRATIPNVSVTVKNLDTGLSRTFTTSSSGNYEVSRLQGAHYTIEAEAAGFRHFVRENVFLFPGATLRVDVRLEVASITAATTSTMGCSSRASGA